jgi:hypothetical protein
VRPRSDSVNFERDPRPPLHRMSLFAAARRERRHRLLGERLLSVYAIAVAIALFLIVKGP